MTTDMSRREIDAMLAVSEDEGATQSSTVEDMETSESRSAQESSFRRDSTASSAGGYVGMARVYRTVRTAKLATLGARPLKGGPTTTLAGIGALVSDDDLRHTAAHMRHSYSKKLNISTSFNMDTMMCTSCLYEEHLILTKETAECDPTSLQPLCFVLSDQNFSPVVPAAAEGGCLKIVRVEDGKLWEITKVFLECTAGFIMPAGSVVLLSSMSHMAWGGTTAYAEDFVAAVNDIKRSFGTDVKTLHGLPLLLQGTEDGAAIQTWIEIEQWLSHLRSFDTRDISDSRQINLQPAMGAVPSTQHLGRGAPSTPLIPSTTSNSQSAISTLMGAPSTPRPSPLGDKRTVPASPSAAGTGVPVVSPPSALYHGTRMRLPTSVDSSARSIFVSEFTQQPPTQLKAVSENTENRILTNLIGELNVKFDLGLATDFTCRRDHSVQSGADSEPEKTSRRKLIVVGMSHASRLAAALELQGHTVTDLSQPGWKPDPPSILALAEKIKTCVEEMEGETTIVYHMYDNFVYMSAGTFGERTLPARDTGDGKFHVKGRLTLVGRPEFKEIFGCLTPLLRAGGEAEKFILAPLIRYLFAPCCEEEGHLMNYGTEDYSSIMGEALSEIKDWIDDMSHSKRIKSYTVVCPNSIMGMNDKGNIDRKMVKELARLWGRDPVHMAPAAYDMLATRLLKLAPAKESGNPGPTEDTCDRAVTRPDWVSRNDGAARRRYYDEYQGGRGGGRGHGGRGYGGRGGFGGGRGGYNGGGRNKGNWVRGSGPQTSGHKRPAN